MKKRVSNKWTLSKTQAVKVGRRDENKPQTLSLELPTAEDVAKIRRKFGLSQPRFAELMAVSVATVRNWEQGRSDLHGSAKKLLWVAQKMPDIFLKDYIGD